MPRIPSADLERLKQDISLERLATSRGIALIKKGKDRHGKCPFHDDKTPSLVIDIEKNLWRCFGACNAGGSVVDWIMRERGVSFRHAVELLRHDLPGALDSPPATRIKVTTVRTLPAAVVPSADDRQLLAQVAAYYHKKLKEAPAALAYLEQRGLSSPGLVDHFQIGFSDRTLGLTIPEANRKAGADLRERLTRIGILNAATGHELYRGMLTIPTFDTRGQVVGLYGRRASESMRETATKHRNLSGQLSGLLNPQAFSATDEMILCEAPLDALTFWAAGYKNVTATFGTSGFTDELADALRTSGTKRVLLAYDRDAAGDAGAQTVAPRLQAQGLDCYRILFPRGMDANAYALKVKPADKSLGLLIRKAEWLGNGARPAREPAALPTSALAPAPAPESAPAPTRESADTAAPRMASELPGQLPLFAAGLPDSAPPAEPLPEPTPEAAKKEALSSPAPDANVSPELITPLTPEPATAIADRSSPAASPLPAPPRPTGTLTVDPASDSATLIRGDRTYRVRGLAQNTSYAILRVNLRVHAQAGVHVDTLDLLQARQRAAFEKIAALELGLAEGIIKDDLGALLNLLDELQDAAIKKALEPKAAVPTMTADERADALAFLRSPSLVDRILADFEAAGCVGEETNKLIGYLACVSRKLRRPLALIVQSTSAAGKSTLMDAILDFVPEEDREQYSALTGQALFYMGETNLAHKILAIVEEEGAERASYALKLLQSEGELTIASTGKDPVTGRLVTHEYNVQGPVMIFLTTTASDLDDELQNRCLILAVNEDRQQTQRIHQLQRAAHTLDGLVADAEKADLLKRHQNAQRLLAPLAVENPFVHRLAFPDDKTRTRRDHAKYLNLIDAIALLHQHQRPIRTHTTPTGKTLRYTQVTAADIRLANRLADEVLGRSLDELPPQTRRLLELLDGMVTQAADHLECDRRDYRFTRRQVREVTGWGNTQLKLHLARLEDFEYLATHRAGHGLSFAYELLYDGRGADGRPFVIGLIDPDAVSTAAVAGSSTGADSRVGDTTTIPNRSGESARWSGQTRARSAPGRPEVGGRPGGGRPQENPHAESDLAGKAPESDENAHWAGIEKSVSYARSPRARRPLAHTARPAPVLVTASATGEDPAGSNVSDAASAPAHTGASRLAKNGNGRSHPKALPPRP